MLAVAFLIGCYCYPGPYKSYIEINVNPTGFKELQDLKWNQEQASLVLCQFNDLWSSEAVLRDYKLIPKDYLPCWVKGRTEIEGGRCQELFSINETALCKSIVSPGLQKCCLTSKREKAAFHSISSPCSQINDPNWNYLKFCILKCRCIFQGIK